jgi:hypothetical protein
MAAHLPPEIEQLLVAEVTDVASDLAAAGLM